MSIDVLDGIRNYPLLEAVQVLQANATHHGFENCRRRFLENQSTLMYSLRTSYYYGTSHDQMRKYCQTGASLAAAWADCAAGADQQRLSDVAIALQTMGGTLHRGDLRDDLLRVMDAIAVLLGELGTIADESSSTSFSRERSSARRIDKLLNHLPRLRWSVSFLHRSG